jgi:hypothetical protein
VVVGRELSAAAIGEPEMQGALKQAGCFEVGEYVQQRPEASFVPAELVAKLRLANREAAAVDPRENLPLVVAENLRGRGGWSSESSHRCASGAAGRRQALEPQSGQLIRSRPALRVW